MSILQVLEQVRKIRERKTLVLEFVQKGIIRRVADHINPLIVADVYIDDLKPCAAERFQ